MIKEANVTVMISDMDQSIQFYVEKLGLKLKTRYGNQFAEVECPGLTIALHPAFEHGPRPGNSESLSVGLGVEDIDEAIASLKGKGVAMDRISNDGPVILAFFKDPDGNPLYLSQTQSGGKNGGVGEI
jgi:catechol 2,3-dioxygenase-like lactoylglutathione lyase family enzyme